MPNPCALDELLLFIGIYLLMSANMVRVILVVCVVLACVSVKTIILERIFSNFCNPWMKFEYRVKGYDYTYK